jgi:hypothetical protein
MRPLKESRALFRFNLIGTRSRTVAEDCILITKDRLGALPLVILAYLGATVCHPARELA